MRRWVEYYREILGFSDDPGGDPSREQTGPSTESPGYASKAVTGGGDSVKLLLNEPVYSREKSEVEQYLEFYHGPGVQHVALATDNILDTVDKMRGQGVEFLDPPPNYYTRLNERAGNIAEPSILEPIDELERLGILVEPDEDGYLLQAFTRAGRRPSDAVF